MNISSLEITLTKLERQASAATVTDKNLVTLRLRRLTTALEPRFASRATFSQEDDLLFDNVPV